MRPKQISESCPVSSEMVVIYRKRVGKKQSVVGESWQPDVAQFLQDMYPDGLENGMALADMYRMATATSADDFWAQLDSIMDDLDIDLLSDDDDDGGDE